MYFFSNDKTASSVVIGYWLWKAISAELVVTSTAIKTYKLDKIKFKR